MNKPGYKTPAFYFSAIITALSAVAASGADLGFLGSAVALVVTGLTAAGYTAFRVISKSEDPKKPAYKTTEFWLTLAAAVVSALYASGALSAGGTAEKIVGVAAMLLSALGYQVGKVAKR